MLFKKGKSMSENKILFDGVEVSEEELKNKLEEANSNPNIKVKVVSEGVYKTLKKLEG